MGYTTDFSGGFQLSRDLKEAEMNYINSFSGTRRMERDVNKLMELYKGEYGNPFATEQTPEGIYGVDGEYFVCDDGQFGQSKDDSIIDYNYPPITQPGLWCQWIIDDGIVMHDGGEKFYEYVPWIKYLITHFFSKWGVLLNGEVEWVGEHSSDLGKIVIKDNIVTVHNGTVVYDEYE